MSMELQQKPIFFPPSFLYIVTSLKTQQMNHSDFVNFSASLGSCLYDLNYPAVPLTLLRWWHLNSNCFSIYLSWFH